MEKIPEHTKALFTGILKILEPPPDLTVSSWADNYRMLSSESSATPGRWKTAKAPYQKEMMDAISDSNTEKVVVMSAAQIGKTDSLILNPIAYYMDYDPCPIMVMMPTKELAETLSKDRLSPMLRDTPRLQGKVNEQSKNSGNTIHQKVFPGGHVTMVGANSGAGLSSRPIRVVLADEIDRYPPAIGNEGDPLMLAEKRTTTFWNKKIVCVSTPTTKGFSRIEQEYNNSTQEEWHVPCPQCNELTPLTWANIIFDKNDFHEDSIGTSNFEEVSHVCPHCGAVSSEVAWKEQGQQGKFIPTFANKGVRGFHLNSLASGFVSWAEVVRKFLQAMEEKETGNIEPLRTWTNLEMGELWEEEGTKIDAELIAERREIYGCEVPSGVIILTVAIDTQDDRFELEVMGWGEGKESWGIKYMVIRGDLKQERPWQELSDQLLHTYTTEDGRVLSISSGCMDSGGHFTTEVYKFCKLRYHQGIYAIKGRGGDLPLYRAPTTSNIAKTPLVIVGVDQGKDLVYGRLAIKKEGAGYCHFPLEEDRGYDDNYFKGLTSEIKIRTYTRGKAKQVWVKKRGKIRNEPLDIRNYNTVAMELVSYLLVPTSENMEKPKRKGRGNRSKGVQQL